MSTTLKRMAGTPWVDAVMAGVRACRLADMNSLYLSLPGFADPRKARHGAMTAWPPHSPLTWATALYVIHLLVTGLL